MEIGDYPGVLALWRATEGLSLRDADSEDALRRYLERNPGLSEGIEKCHLFVRTDNPEAVAFWRRIGWVERDDLVMMSFSSGGPNA